MPAPLPKPVPRADNESETPPQQGQQPQIVLPRQPKITTLSIDDVSLGEDRFKTVKGADVDGYELVDDYEEVYANIPDVVNPLMPSWSPNSHRRPLPSPSESKSITAPWFHQQISENEQERLLLGPNARQDGVFIVSKPPVNELEVSAKPRYCLSYAFMGDIVTHILLRNDAGKWTIDGQPVGAPRFAELEAVVDFLVAKRPRHTSLSTALVNAPITHITAI